MKPHSSAFFLLCAAIGFCSQSCSAPEGKDLAIRVRCAYDPESLNPLQLPNQQAFDAANLLHVSLLQADFSKKEIAPALAEALPTAELVGDSLTRVSYRIRPAATWDTGGPVLATDVAFTLKLMFCPGVPNETSRLQFGFIQGLIPDPHDPRRFTLECRGQGTEYQQATGDFFILPEAALDPQGELRRFSLAALQRRPQNAPDSGLAAVARRYRALAPGKLPGCGPYQLTAWEKDRYLAFRRKANWWGSRLRPTPFVLQARSQKLAFVIIPDAATASLALQRGDLDIFPQMPAREFARLRKATAARPALSFYSVPSYDVVTAGFNTRRPALADALTRRALSHCFNAAGLLQATQMGEGQQTVGIISPLDRQNYNDSLAPVPFDLAKAEALVRQAGWQRRAGTETGWVRTRPGSKQPEVLQVSMRYRADETTFATIALQFKAAAASLGIAVSLLPTEAGSFTTALRTSDFDMYVRTLKGNPFMFNLAPLLHSRAIGQSNTTGYSGAASDRLLDAIAVAENPTRRAQLLRKFQTLMQAEMPWVPLFFLPTRIAASHELTGLHVTGLKPGFALTAVERSAKSTPTP
ncbi:ABC transporter substrate-binding protein [Hymenobacter sp. BT683]|uniref:ABC transporter substrate-binding protein n=1 Tax=Hymenobacter jeongseonensis TaxID=2791027 RepID=A0ABS0IL97_9BACT|nr:ABC transporter substrate-binding protein [Hymenobacter jeongseonensis]MBF9239111.1 ABC transporter substrate-binding protein [Hymenobacter jeongseonensis]